MHAKEAVKVNVEGPTLHSVIGELMVLPGGAWAYMYCLIFGSELHCLVYCVFVTLFAQDDDGKSIAERSTGNWRPFRPRVCSQTAQLE